MGEYVKRGKDTVKIGTCEDLYYTTYEEFKALLPHLSKAQGSLVPEEYLKSDEGFRFRFPFFGETDSFGNYELFNKGFLIKIPRRLLSNNEMRICHQDRFNRIELYSGLNYAFKHKCPASHERDYSIQSPECIDDYLTFELVQQKMVDNQLQTVVRCPFCNNLTRFSKEDMEQIAAVILDPENTWTDEATEENIKTAIKGYVLGK